MKLKTYLEILEEQTRSDLYTILVKSFHPDIKGNTRENHEKMVLINQYARNENKLIQLAQQWGIKGSSSKPFFTERAGDWYTFLENIRNECSGILNIYQRNKGVLWFNGARELTQRKKVPAVRLNSQFSDIDEKFRSEFGWYPIKEGIQVVNYPIKSLGYPAIFIPANGFKYIWSTNTDLTRTLQSGIRDGFGPPPHILRTNPKAAFYTLKEIYPEEFSSAEEFGIFKPNQEKINRLLLRYERERSELFDGFRDTDIASFLRMPTKYSMTVKCLYYYEVPETLNDTILGGI